MIEFLIGLFFGLGTIQPAVGEEQPNSNAVENITFPMPESSDEQNYLETPGEQTYQVFLDPLYRTRLFAEVNVPIEKIYKRMGDSFNKGEKLIDFQKNVFEGAYWKAKAALSKAETAYEGKKQLFNDGILSLFELKEAESDVAAAKSDLAVAKKNLESSTIRAPYKGKVVTLYIEEHELPQTGKELIEIVDDEILLAKLLLPSNLLGKLHNGQIINIHVRETNMDVPAKITRISPVIDPSSSTIKVEAEIDNSQGKLSAGMIGTLSIPNK